VAIAIETLRVLRGALLRRAHALVVESASQHQDELLADWHLARAKRPLVPVAPLE
jgi:hypothetical protein